MAALADYLSDQVQALQESAARLRAGQERSVHDHRVAVRRLRSTLRTFAEVLPDPGALDRRLAEHGARLGQVRDLEVLFETLGTGARGPARDRLQRAVAADLATARDGLQAWLESPAVAGLVDDLAAYVAALPAAEPDLAPYVRAARKRAQRLLRRAGAHQARLHQARKAAKRARYAAEVVGDTQAAARHEYVQDHLGTHHDCAVAIDHLRNTTMHAGDEEAVAAMVADLQHTAEEARHQALTTP